jgi:hypothetical protein
MAARKKSSASSEPSAESSDPRTYSIDYGPTPGLRVIYTPVVSKTTRDISRRADALIRAAVARANDSANSR